MLKSKIITEGDLQRPDFFRLIGCKVHLGRPSKIEDTVDAVILFDLPKERTSFVVLNCLQEIGIGIISSHPIAGGALLLPLNQAKAYRKRQPYAVAVEGKEWENLIGLKPSYIVLNDLQFLDQFAEWLQEHGIKTPIVVPQVDLCRSMRDGKIGHEL